MVDHGSSNDRGRGGQPERAQFNGTSIRAALTSTHTRMLQSSPLYPGGQKHDPLRQTPTSEQSFGQISVRTRTCDIEHHIR